MSSLSPSFGASVASTLVAIESGYDGGCSKSERNECIRFAVCLSMAVNTLADAEHGLGFPAEMCALLSSVQSVVHRCLSRSLWESEPEGDLDDYSGDRDTLVAQVQVLSEEIEKRLARLEQFNPLKRKAPAEREPLAGAPVRIGTSSGVGKSPHVSTLHRDENDTRGRSVPAPPTKTRAPAPRSLHSGAVHIIPRPDAAMQQDYYSTGYAYNEQVDEDVFHNAVGGDGRGSVSPVSPPPLYSLQRE